MNKREQLQKIFDAVGVRVVSINVGQLFGEEILSIYPHVADLYTCNFDKLCDGIEAAGFKIEVAKNGTTIKVK